MHAMRSLNRRRFLCTGLGACGVLGLGMTAWLRQVSRSGDAGGDAIAVGPGGLVASSESAYALGSEVSITALHREAAVARRAVRAAMAELRLVEEVMSLYRPQSQLCRLNREGVVEAPHAYLVEILRHAGAVSARSGGAFDITVQPLWSLYSEAQKAGRLPDAAAVGAAVQAVDWRRVEVSAARVRLHGAGTAVTLNGIAQGFAADRAVAALRRHGIEHALVDAGETAAIGRKAGGEPWTAGIQHPRRPDAYVWLAKLRDRCLATSGDYATTFAADFRDHHIFDPHTGRSPTEFASVSVAATTATEADALSTAMFVLGWAKGLELVQSTPGADALLVSKDGKTLATEGFPADA